MDNIITIENLTFEYTRGEESDPVKAIDNISLEIERGSFTAIIGKNGSGKSTLAKTLTDCCCPQKGRYMYTDTTPGMMITSGM